MKQTVAILGRQPAMGRAELESLYGSTALQPVGGQAVLLNMESAEVDFSRLGGILKLAELQTSINGNEWPQIVKYISSALPQILNNLPEGKIRLGISVYGLPVKSSTINKTALDLKKLIKRQGKSVRVVPNTNPELNTAQVIHNQLTGPTGIELLLIRHGQKTLLARTVKVQNIQAYAARDQARPKRDARVGMLPPKLAQILINLAAGQKGATDTTLLDPFCGTGVVLQEALLMGFGVYGTDLEPRMVEYSKANLDWLMPDNNAQLEIGDACEHQWSPLPQLLAAETYLGRPFTALPNPDVLSQVQRDVETIHRKFLKNLASQTSSGFRACLAVPAWRTNQGFQHLRTLDSLQDLGYTRMSFVHANQSDLIYHREGQIVGRELVVITRK